MNEIRRIRTLTISVVDSAPLPTDRFLEIASIVPGAFLVFKQGRPWRFRKRDFTSAKRQLAREIKADP
jgi:hypothetical protein